MFPLSWHFRDFWSICKHRSFDQFPDICQIPLNFQAFQIGYVATSRTYSATFVRRLLLQQNTSWKLLLKCAIKQRFGGRNGVAKTTKSRELCDHRCMWIRRGICACVTFIFSFSFLWFYDYVRFIVTDNNKNNKWSLADNWQVLTQS